jgi:type II secretory pathway predicted ATPase ExeA
MGQSGEGILSDRRGRTRRETTAGRGDEIEPMWERHWRLSRDPFCEADAPFVPTPGHAEAVARLVYAIEAGQRWAALHAAGGMGKTTVLSRALAETWSTVRRVARVSSPTDGPALHAGLAEGLGHRVPIGAGRALAWRRLAEAVRLCHWQGLAVVLAVDDSHHLSGPDARLDLERLLHIAPQPETSLTVLHVGRDGPEVRAWEPSFRLLALTRGDAEGYLAAKLAAAGREGLTFTPRAVTRLHAHSRGVPRELDRLASLALMAGAARGLEVVPPEVVDGVAREFAPIGREP